MEQSQIDQVIEILREDYPSWKKPAVTIVAECERNPFKVLVSCIISLRTRDEVTAEVTARLFARAATPDEIRRLSQEELEGLLYPAGFYRNKAAQIREIARCLADECGGEVPAEIDQLLRFKGVGRKTANLVVTLGFGKPGICVDTHVHRICNRWGYVSSMTPYETEMQLRDRLPARYWSEINELLVAFGQNRCQPVSPFCSTCRLFNFCDRIGVRKHR